ncbi:MAG: MATE family efflux transporter [Lachnospiraceae bacterium]|nr:MATE family efflux transporter [Lachnospiraceae bacterium]
MERREFYKSAIKLTLPVVVQNLLSATISSTDVVMLNYVGQSSISAVSLAANITSVLFMIYYGIGTGVTMLASQYSGKGDLEAIHLVQGIALRFSVAVSALFSAFAFFAPQLLMKIFTNDAQLTDIGCSYLRIVAFSYLCWSITEVYMASLRSVERVAICTVLNVIAFVCNIFLNAVFIFGLFGLPKLGAAGVALGTTLSRLVVLIGCFIVSAKSKNVKLKLSYIFKNNKLLLHDFFSMALPALINDVSWGVAFTMYSAIIGHLGNDAVAAYSFVNVVRNFGSVFCFAVANVAGIILGNIMGEGKLDEAKTAAKRLMVMTLISALIGSLIIFALIPAIMSFADLTEQAMHYLKYMMLINTYYIFGAAVNTTLIAGVFRAGGDSKFGMICDTIDMWCYAVPLGFLCAFVFKLPVMWVYVILCTDEFVKWPWVLKNYFSGKWIKNITRDDLYEEGAIMTKS